MTVALPQEQSLRVQKWVALVSILLLTAKFAAYFYTSSVAVLTDAMESIVNVVASLIGLYSLYVAAQPRDYNHPYGHGKAEFLSAAIEGVLIGIAGLIIVYEAIHKLFFPAEIKKADWGIIILGATAFINYAMGIICIKVGKKNKSLALQVSGKHLQTDTYSTFAVIISLVILYFTNLIWIDALVAILLAAYILYTSYKIVRQSVAGIMDEADTNLLKSLIALINANRQTNWVDLHNLRIIKFGSILHVDAHLTLPWYFSVRNAHQEIDNLSAIIRKKYGETLELFIHSDGCDEDYQCPICIKADCAVRKQPFQVKVEWDLANVLKNKRHNTQSSSLNS